MRWSGFIGIIALCGGTLLFQGCSRSAPPGGEAGGETQQAPNGSTSTRPASPILDVSSTADVKGDFTLSADYLAAKPPEATVQEIYNNNLLDALNLVMDRKYSEALATLELARTAQDTDQIRSQIEKVKNLIQKQAEADRTVQNLETVLTDGKSEEAGQLATAALQEFGDTDAAPRLTKLKREADALTATQLDRINRRNHFREEGDAALREQNLRAAAIAFEQALVDNEDPALRRQFDDVQNSLGRYDENRRRALELRRDPNTLEGALAALQEAARTWDTVQVRQEIDDCTLALQKRRNTISVVDFEVRGDVGIPYAGRTVAEEIFPAFKRRFDLVERGQVNRVIDELRLEASELADNANSRQEIGRLAKVRYLVVGSVSALSGITVNARLVEVHSGLVVQTAKLVARTSDEMLGRLSQLANILMMSDEQKFAYEQQMSQQPPVTVVNAPLPPPPPAQFIQQPPPPIIVYSPRPPDLGGVRVDDFNRLPPTVGQEWRPPAVNVVVQRENPVRKRLLQVAVQLGDNLFMRGRFREAHTQFELALNLSPDHDDIQIRIDRCRPHLPPPPPPPPPVVVAPPPAVVVFAPPPPPVTVVAVPPPPRPRIAILNFVVNADASLAPPGFGDWAAETIGSYFRPAYEVVDRGETFWYMGRLGLTVRDVLTDPSARLWLGRALNVRFFVFGVVQQTASFNVTTHLVDSENNTTQGGGSIHVQDHQEFKLRMGELANQTMKDPAKAPQANQEAKENEKVVNDARRLLREGKPEQAAQAAQAGLKTRGDNVALASLLQQAEQQAIQKAAEEKRRQEVERYKASLAARDVRQQQVVRQTEAARLRVDQNISARPQNSRRPQEEQREKAYAQLMKQGQLALEHKNYQQSIQLFESAIALKPDDAGIRQLAVARGKLDEFNRVQKGQDDARRLQEKQRQEEANLAQTRARIDQEHKRLEAEQKARQKAQEEKDRAVVEGYLTQGKQFLNAGKVEEAVSVLQTAQRLGKNPEGERLLKLALDTQARAKIEKQNGAARAEAEKKMAEEKAFRAQADAKMKQNQEAYKRTMQAAQNAFANKHYSEAATHYREAGNIFKTDEVLKGLQSAQQAQDQERARQEVETKRKSDRSQRDTRFGLLMQEGQKAFRAKKLDDARRFFEQASQLNPENVEARTYLARVEQQSEEMQTKARRQEQDRERQTHFQKLLDAGRANMASGQYSSAVLALREAVTLNPGDVGAQATLREAEKKLAPKAPDPMPNSDAQKIANDYQKWMSQGRTALGTRQFEAAAKAFREAQRLVPGDQASQTFLRDAEKGQRDLQAMLDLQAKKRVEEVQADQKRKVLEEDRQREFGRLMVQVQTSVSSRRFEDAVRFYGEAVKLQPGNAEAKRALANASQALRMAPPPAVPPAPALPNSRIAAEFGVHMQAAVSLEKQKKFAEAAKEYREALRLLPADPRAVQALRAAEYSQHMTEGQKALAGRRFPEASREFQEALKIFPENQEAQKFLKKATEGKP